MYNSGAQVLSVPLGPKWHQSVKILSDKTKVISHNMGSVPFGSQTDGGRKYITRTGTTTSVPGPGAYSHDKLNLIRPQALKVSN